MKAVEIVQHRHVEGRGDRAFILVAAHVDVVVVRATICQTMDQPRIGVKREDDVFVFREEIVEVGIAQSVRVFRLRLQSHEIDDVDDADF